MNPLVISFERSKKWAAIMEKFSNLKHDSEIAIDDLHLIYSDEEEEIFENVEKAIEVDCAEESDVLQDITNRKCTSDDGANPLPESLNMEDVEFLNQTRLVLQNNERLWENAGIYKILNTFNVRKIQEKVGGWLERHNSEIKQNSFIDLMASRRPEVITNPMQNDSDTESLQSGDTAQYIRSSRKRQCHTVATTTTIKRFRLAQSKRDELREKYASLVDSDDEQRCRLLIKQRRRNECASGKISKKYKDVRVAGRPKCLRKRRYRNIPDYSSDSSEQSLSTECTGKNCPRSARLSKCCARSVTKIMQHKYHRMLNFEPYFSLSSYNSSENSTLFRLLSSNDDMRPIMFESECQCRNDRQLCELNLHITEESRTDSWLVENLKVDTKQQAKTTKSRAVTKSAKRRKLNQRKHEQSTPYTSPERSSIVCNSTALPDDLKAARQLENLILVSNNTKTHPRNLVTVSAGHSQVDLPTIDREPENIVIVSSSSDNDTQQDIVLYKPGDTTNSLVQNADGTITISEVHLSSHFGKKRAAKVFKRWVGSKRFNANSTVLFKPTKAAWNAESTASDSDELESIFKYGRIYVN